MEFYGPCQNIVAPSKDDSNGNMRQISHHVYISKSASSHATNAETTKKLAFCVVSVPTLDNIPYEYQYIDVWIILEYFCCIATCYKKVMDETKMMQAKIEEKLGLNPVDKSVVVLYEGEKQEQVLR